MLTGLLFVWGCGAAKTGPYTITNSTTDVVTVEISAESYTSTVLQIPAGETQDTLIYYYTPVAKVIKSSTEKQILDNRYTAMRTGFKIEIKESPSITYTIKNLIPEDRYTGSEILYLTEEDNKIGIYTPSNDNKVSISKNQIKTVTVYSNSPVFKIKNESEIENKLNDYPITVTFDNDNIIILR